jgi:hypothetical protein
MSKIPLPQNKESLIGYALFSGGVILFVINAVVLIQSLIAVYGVSEIKPNQGAIDGTVLSEAVKIITSIDN